MLGYVLGIGQNSRFLALLEAEDREGQVLFALLQCFNGFHGAVFGSFYVLL